MGAAVKVSIHPDEITAQAPTFATESQFGQRPAPDAEFAPEGLGAPLGKRLEGHG